MLYFARLLCLSFALSFTVLVVRYNVHLYFLSFAALCPDSPLVLYRTAEGVEDRTLTLIYSKTPAASIDPNPAPATNGVANDEDNKGPCHLIQTPTTGLKRAHSADPSTRTSCV